MISLHQVERAQAYADKILAIYGADHRRYIDACVYVDQLTAIYESQNNE